MDHPSIVRVSAAATKSDHEAVAVVTTQLIEIKVADANVNPRRREIHFFHSGDGDSLHRMLNTLQPGSYIRPHRHETPPKAESVILLQGQLGCVTFANEGEVIDELSVLLDVARGTYAVDYRAGTWHTFFALEPGTVVFEVKPGPYSPLSDKDFAAWAPREGSTEASAYLARLEDTLRRQWRLPARAWNFTGSGCRARP